MRSKTAIKVTLLFLFGFHTSSVPALDSSDLPRLRRQGTATQLIVDGQPFLIRGGELGNSSGEPDYLRQFWPKLKGLNLNTVIAPVYWDLLEPKEGQFDFATVDGLIRDAREQQMRLVLLWFGSWKNSMSCYAPGWVKRDVDRFRRTVDSSGHSQEILSPFSASNRDADARAFAALMRHLRQSDAVHTVILVQVENEVGMIPDARDHSPEANKLFAGSVPAELVKYLAERADTLAPELRLRWQSAGAKRSGSWTEVFGPGSGTEEVFMAWHFAKYTGAVAAAGKAELGLPMYANAALIRPGYEPGQYPSAGPLPHLFDIWRAAAPALDFLSPDIYFPTFIEWTRRYTSGGNPLFIPEAIRNADAAVNALYAFGQRDAIGFSPFGIESITEPAAAAVRDSFNLVDQLTPLILEHQGRGTMAGLLSTGDPETRQPQEIRLGGYVIHASFERAVMSAPANPGAARAAAGPAGAPSPSGGGLIIATVPDEFLVAGTGVTLTFAGFETGVQAGILSVEEGRYAGGNWQHVRWLNGDETHQGRHLRIEPGRFGIQRIKLYMYR